MARDTPSLEDRRLRIRNYRARMNTAIHLAICYGQDYGETDQRTLDQWSIVEQLASKVARNARIIAGKPRGG